MSQNRHLLLLQPLQYLHFGYVFVNGAISSSSTQHIELVKVMEESSHLSGRQLPVRLYEKHLSLFNSDTNVSERNTSKVVTPNNLRLS